MEKQKYFEYHCIFSTESAIKTLLNMPIGDTVSVDAHLLNPILRIMETLNRSVLVKTIYQKDSKDKVKPKYEIRMIPDRLDVYPQIWSVNFKENPDYEGYTTPEVVK